MFYYRKDILTSPLPCPVVLRGVTYRIGEKRKGNTSHPPPLPCPVALRGVLRSKI